MGVNPRSVLERKLFTMSFYTTYWRYKFFQHHLRVNTEQVEKYAIKTRKVRISAGIDIQKILILLPDKLDIHSNQTKKELPNYH